MPLPPPTPCAGCNTTSAVAYLDTNAAELGHAQHGRLCSDCWRLWMAGKRWTGKDSGAADLEEAWEEADAGREAPPAVPDAPLPVDLFGKPLAAKAAPKRRRR